MKHIVLLTLLLLPLSAIAQLNVVANDSSNVLMETKYAWPVTVSGFAVPNLAAITGIQTGGISSNYKSVVMKQSMQTIKGIDGVYFHCCNKSTEPSSYIRFCLGKKDVALRTLNDFLPLFKKKASDFPLEVSDADGQFFIIEFPHDRADVGKMITIRPKGDSGFCIISKKHVNNMMRYLDDK